MPRSKKKLNRHFVEAIDTAIDICDGDSPEQEKTVDALNELRELPAGELRCRRRHRRRAAHRRHGDARLDKVVIEIRDYDAGEEFNEENMGEFRKED